MDNKLITIPFEDVYPAAERYFLATAGLNRENNKHKRMWIHALAIYEEIRGKGEIKALIHNVIPEKAEGRDFYFRGVKISCNAFERIQLDNVNGAYFYIITARDAQTESEQVIDQLYGDIWGTSIVDAAREKIRDCIISMDKEKDENSILSDSFGPGYYGMELLQSADIFRIIDPSLVNVTLNPGGMMRPQKSITGLYLSVKNGEILPPATCENCIGGSSGCTFCNRWER